MQRIGPARVAKMAWDMGVRQSKLDQVPSLALGTSPVTLKEMVSAFGTIANGGSYIEPVLVTRIEDRSHRVLEAFQPRAPERALPPQAAETLLDVMRGVVDRGTGAGVRSRFGIRGDVAGKTGTTQSNTDGWFILMHPQLVGGAWVGFNDNRVTMRGNAWGQGAHNALNIVGDFFQQTLKAKAIDAKAKFAAPHIPDPPSRMSDWYSAMFGHPAAEATVPQPAPVIIVQPPSAAMQRSVPEQAVVAQPELPPSLQRVPEIQRSYEPPRGPVTLRMDRQGQIIIIPREAAPNAGEAGTTPQ
jgi:penicillin-binding protein 1A